MISAEEIARRKSVWIALSEFYLDTELGHNDFVRIAKILSASGYALEQLKKINYEEVAPVVAPNLMSVAGVWNGFDEEWLAMEILRKIKGPKAKSIRNAIFRKYVDWMTKRYWKPIQELMKVPQQS